MILAWMTTVVVVIEYITMPTRPEFAIHVSLLLNSVVYNQRLRQFDVPMEVLVDLLVSVSLLAMDTAVGKLEHVLQLNVDQYAPSTASMETRRMTLAVLPVNAMNPHRVTLRLSCVRQLLVQKEKYLSCQSDPAVPNV